MSNLSYAFRENALAAYKSDVRVLNSKSSHRPEGTAARSFKSETHSSQSSSSHGNLEHKYHTSLKTTHPFSCESTKSHLKSSSTKQKHSNDPYLAALTKETRGKTKKRYSSTDYLMQW